MIRVGIRTSPQEAAPEATAIDDLRSREGNVSMSKPGKTRDLALPGATADEVGAAQTLLDAAQLVENFADQGGRTALDSLLLAADEAPSAAAKRAGEIATRSARKAATLQTEVARFLRMTCPTASVSDL
jgi:hypothetical protein